MVLEEHSQHRHTDKLVGGFTQWAALPSFDTIWLQNKLFYAYEKFNLFFGISAWVITLVINLSWYSVVLHTLKNKHSRTWLQKRHNLFCWRIFSSRRKDKKTCTHYYDIVTIKKEVDLGWYLVFLTRYQPYLVLLDCLLSLLKVTNGSLFSRSHYSDTWQAFCPEAKITQMHK